ncbi:complex I subunit 5 family protein [Myxococcaceae bacterium GXIMD 01537]
MRGLDLPALAVIAALGAPVLLACMVMLRDTRAAALRLAPWAPLPALGLGLGLWPGEPVYWSSVLLGTRLYAPGDVTRIFLLFTGLLWLLAGLYAAGYMREDPRRPAFWGFFLATMAGNIGAVLAWDMAGFYMFFAGMTFCAYGLIIHERSPEAARAGRVYIIMALLGETLLLTALFLIAGTRINLPLDEVPQAVAVSPQRDLIVGLLLAGFGVKMGAVPLHMWLPLAHPVAPTPASAVLSGAIIKAGVLGWLRFLPLGWAASPTTGTMCVALGLTAMFFAALVGVTQRNAKTVLAYSSVSQMGFITLAVGLALRAPEGAAVLTSAILVFALHHALAKGLLFLGTGVVHATGRVGWRGALAVGGLLWSALEIAGAPLTSGALAKLALKSAVASVPHGDSLPTLLSVAAVGSTLLMARFMACAVPRDAARGAGNSGPLLLPWLLLLAADLALLVRPPIGAEELPHLLQPKSLWAASWPVLLGLALSATVVLSRRARPWRVPEVPPGDVLCLVERPLQWARLRLDRAGAHGAQVLARWDPQGRSRGLLRRQRDDLFDDLHRAEARLSRLRELGVVLLLWLGVFLFLTR